MQPRTLEFAKYVVLFTTFPAEAVLECTGHAGRSSWSSSASSRSRSSGTTPQHTDESAKAWLHGKLLVALLVAKLLAHARSISPRGCRVEAAATA